jgi:hypothetical protein
MDLKNTQLKDTYGNLLTIGTTAGSPTTGTLENGDGEDITALDVAGTITSNGLIVEGIVEIDGSAFGNISKQAFTRTDASWSINNETALRIYGNTGDTTSPSTKRMELNTGGDISFYDSTGTNPNFFWDASAGSLGIGTDNPATRLDIQGVGGATTSPSVTATTGTSYIGWKSVNTGGSFWTAIDNSTGSSFSTGTAYARVLWSNGAYPMVFSTNSTERLRINSSGNVGIGTDAPGARLNVAGALGAVIGGGASAIRMTNTDTSNYASISAGIVGTSNGGMDFSVDGTRRMVISGSGKVGIGTDSPSAPLSIDTGTTGTIAQFRGADTDILNIDGDSDAIVLDARNVAYLGFEMQGSEKMRINSSGNVGYCYFKHYIRNKCYFNFRRFRYFWRTYSSNCGNR